MRGSITFVLGGSVVLLALSLSTSAAAYPEYSDTGIGGCNTCHGDFRASPYYSLADATTWTTSLHDAHRYDMLGGDCSTCHSSGGRSPVHLSSSSGGSGLDPIACMGCHGRAEDTALGAGLRQHHYDAGMTTCATCHADANPAAYTPAGEDVLPPYYASPGTGHPAIPADP